MDEADECLPRLEADFCKDFSCCGLVLDDLHHLLQHYEDHHVRIEDEVIPTPMTPPQSKDHIHQAARSRPDMEAMKRKAMLDMQYHLGQTDLHSQAHAVEDEDVAFDHYSQYGDALQSSRKRNWRPSMSTPSVATRDFFTPAQSPASTPDSSLPATPNMGTLHDFPGESENPLLFGPPASSDDWLYQDGCSPMPQIKKARQAQYHQGYATPDMMSPQVIEHPGSSLVVVDKPYKCPVPGCDKAYKNQNGLKYHKMHGNCAANPLAFAAAQASGQPVSYMVQENKPYSCNLCAKRYKNLNGLKYHTAHSHQHVTTDSVLKAIQDSQNSQSVW